MRARIAVPATQIVRKHKAAPSAEQATMPICRGVMTVSAVLTINVVLAGNCTPQRTAANVRGGAIRPAVENERLSRKIVIPPKRDRLASDRRIPLAYHLLQAGAGVDAEIGAYPVPFRGMR
jgi:hypothetical protein